MGKDITTLLAFNRGMVSPLALARQDLKRLALAAEIQTNWMPRVLGPMMLRPGTTYLNSTRSDAVAAHIPFVFATDDTAILEMTASSMRVLIDDAVVTRPSVATAIANDSFTGKSSTTLTFTGAGSANATYSGSDIFVVDDAVSFSNSGGALPAAITAGTTYYVKSVNTGTNVVTFAATRPTASAAATTFATAGTGTHTIYAHAAITSWTDTDESGGHSEWATGDYLSLIGDGTAYAIVEQQLTIAGGDQNVEHALDIHIVRGRATLTIGTTSGGEELLTAVVLRPGYHSIAFTPTGAAAYVRLKANDTTPTLVGSCAMVTAGAMVVTTSWDADDLQNLRYDQSGDVVFVACKGQRQKRIERQRTRSWSVVDYLVEDGPFRVQNTSEITMTAAALTGSTTLTASAPYFRSTNVGSVFKLGSVGQTVTKSLTGADQFTDPIRVTGINAGRVFALTITGTWSASVRLQRSAVEPGDWTNVATYTTNQDKTIDDALDNQVMWYRIGIPVGDYTSGTAVVELSYSGGTNEGTALVTGYTSTTEVSVDVLDNFGSTTATETWWEGAWSDRRGWPSAVALYDGRLWWAGGDRIDGSVSDAFESFDDTVEGDSGPIKRTIGSGPVDTINWILPLGLLIVGTQGAELAAKASSLDEPLTPTAFSLKPISTQGSTDMAAVKIDTNGVFAHRSGARVYELSLDSGSYTYGAEDLTAIVPEIGSTSPLRRIAVQRQPDTRLHFVREDGKVAILIFDRLEKVTCWILYETDGLVEDVVVLPGAVEDQVYYCVKRTINGSTKRYLEKWALETEAQNAARSILSDSTYIWTGASSTTITGLTHLEGKSVVVWANTKDLGTYTVTGGQITISEAATTAYVGLAYTARYKSAKKALGSATGNSLTQRQRFDHVGLVLANTHYQGLRYGQDFDHLDDLPLVEQGAVVAADTIHAEYSEDSVEMNGIWSTDARLCLEAASPRAATVLAVVLTGAGHDKV